MKNKEVLVAPYKAEYFEALIALFLANSPTYFAEEELADFKNYLQDQVEDYFVLLLGDQVIGCGGINYEDTVGIISWDMLSPLHQGQGLGSILVEYRLELLRSKAHIDKVIVRTSQLTYPFYQKQGFILEQIVKDYWAPGFDLYAMSHADWNHS